MEIKTKFRGFDEFERAVNQYPQRALVVFRRTFGEISRGFLRDFRANRLQGRPGLRVRTGALRRSFFSRTDGNQLENLRASVFTDSRYAPIHEFGGTIRAKNPSGYLTFPIFKSNRARSSKIGSFRRAKSVYIPPRLRFAENWESPGNVAWVQFKMRKAAEEVFATMAKSSGKK